MNNKALQKIHDEIWNRMETLKPGRYKRPTLMLEIERMGIPVQTIKIMTHALARARMWRDKYEDQKKDERNVKMKKYRAEKLIKDFEAEDGPLPDGEALQRLPAGDAEILMRAKGLQIAQPIIADKKIEKAEQELEQLQKNLDQTTSLWLEWITAFLVQSFQITTGKPHKGVVGRMLFAAYLEKVENGRSLSTVYKLLRDRVDKRLKTDSTQTFF